MAFTDNFSGGAGNLSARTGWTNANGTATALQTDGSIMFQSSASAHLAICTDQGSANQYCQCLIGDGATAWGMFMVIRCTDINNFIGIYMNHSDGDLSLYKRVSGIFTKLGPSYAVTPSNGDALYEEGSGDDLVVKYNDTTRITATESFNNSATGQGFAVFGAGGTTPGVDLPAIDDYEAGALGGGGPTGNPHNYYAQQ